MRLARRFVVVVTYSSVLACLLLSAGAQDDKPRADAPALRDGFETPEPVWESEHTDSVVRLLEHDRSQRAAHGGRLSEHFHFEAGAGSQFFVSYATPKIQVSDDLKVGLYVRADRAGARLYARIVLPADVDPETKAPSFVLVPGTIFDQVDRWQKLELVQMMPAIERQARVLRVSTRRPVKLEGAYLERVVVNLLGSPGESNVFLDDLEIEPVPESALAGRLAAEGPPSGIGSRPKTPSGNTKAKTTALAPVRLERNLLEKRAPDGAYRPWFPTAIDAPGASAIKLRDAGFDVLIDSMKTDPSKLRAAVERGALIMARLGAASGGLRPQQIVDEINSHPLRSSVAFWYLGDQLGRRRAIEAREEELASVREAIAAVRKLEDDVSHLTLGTVVGDLGLFARAPSGLDMVVVEPQFWGATADPLESYRYMCQRKLMTLRSNLGLMYWGSIPASTSADVIRNVWGDDTPPSWGTPPVQPTQLRQMTYLALAAGVRGIVYRGDAELTRRTGAGRALLIELGFLNFEMDLCEQILAQNENKIRDYSVFDPEPVPVPSNAIQIANRRPIPVKELTPRWGMLAAAIPLRDRKGALVLVGDYGGGSQFQPRQLAADEVTVTLALPEGAQAFEITPGEVKVLGRERVATGTRITLKEFDTTSLIYCSSDLSVGDRLRKVVDGVRPTAVSLAIEQAEILLEAVTEANGRLAADGHEFRSKIDLKRRRRAGIEGAPPDVPDLLADSQKAINNAREAVERQDYAEAWAQARRAQRPLRLVMHGHWEQAQEAFARAAKKFYPLRPGEYENDPDTDLKPKRKEEIPKVPRRPTLIFTPVSCPPLISFFTLPEHYIWVDWIKGMPGYRWGRNRVPSGDFDDPDEFNESGWVDLSYKFEGLVGTVATVARAEPPEDEEDAKKNKNKKKKTPPKPKTKKMIRELEGATEGRVIKLEVKPEDPKAVDKAQPILDFPIAAIRSPRIRVERNNLIRISVLVKRLFSSAEGMGGLIVRDSIGGEQFQFRTSGPIPEYSRVLLFRKAPADGTFTVTLGLAGYGEAFFDDLRVEVVEQDDDRAAPDLVRRTSPERPMRSPRAPDPSVPPAAAAARANQTDRRPR
jgi:hypothetical protein